MSGRRSRVWWFLRLRKAYRNHGANQSWREMWWQAGYSRRPIKRIRA